ncbi:serine hydrolase domain-containing protein [Phenylobacterium sp.]|jgi:CubicO group peptidase (beta-lactamase class C family)|uniref:serine hydrolase domain-containing protein n=1 Tax=Phenylobacterium sp. TaxID=1871053 RepID=UPI002F929AD7
MLRLLSALVAALWMAAGAAAAQPVRIDKGRMDAALQQMVSAGRAAGVSALVWQDGRERYFGAAGFADREARRSMRRDTLVQIWSMTKPVTGVALMQLWEQGRFRLDDPVAQYLPDFGEARVQVGTDTAGRPLTRPPSRPMTIRDLMRHTAGLSYGMRADAPDAEFRRLDPLALSNDLPEMGRRLARVPLHFDPGAEWSYSVSVDVQALLVETLTGQPFEAYVREHILAPLRMTDTGWTQPQDRLARFAATYVVGADGKLARQPDEQTLAMNFRPRRLTMGGAGLVSSVDDYMRFARMLLNGGQLDGARILKPSTVRLMASDHLDPAVTERIWLPSKGNVGFGLNFAVRTGPPKDSAENRGATGEFFWDGAASTLFWVDPANRLTAVFFVQKTPFEGRLHHDIREAVYGPDYLGPAAP